MSTVASVCPECGSTRNRVIDSRSLDGRRRRRRECNNGHRFTTYEISAADLEEIERSLTELREWRMRMMAALAVPVA
jgi:transcriptional regulator NrdR family protein